MYVVKKKNNLRKIKINKQKGNKKKKINKKKLNFFIRQFGSVFNKKWLNP